MQTIGSFAVEMVDGQRSALADFAEQLREEGERALRTLRPCAWQLTRRPSIHGCAAAAARYVALFVGLASAEAEEALEAAKEAALATGVLRAVALGLG